MRLDPAAQGKRTSFLLAISWWGGVRILRRGDAITAPVHNPPAPIRPRRDDLVWFTDVPACLNLAAWHRFILPCDCGGDGWLRNGQTEGAWPSHLDTSWPSSAHAGLRRDERQD